MPVFSANRRDRDSSGPSANFRKRRKSDERRDERTDGRGVVKCAEPNDRKRGIGSEHDTDANSNQLGHTLDGRASVSVTWLPSRPVLTISSYSSYRLRLSSRLTGSLDVFLPTDGLVGWSVGRLAVFPRLRPSVDPFAGPVDHGLSRPTGRKQSRPVKY